MKYLCVQCFLWCENILKDCYENNKAVGYLKTNKKRTLNNAYKLVSVVNCFMLKSSNKRINMLKLYSVCIDIFIDTKFRLNSL